MHCLDVVWIHAARAEETTELTKLMLRPGINAMRRDRMLSESNNINKIQKRAR